MQGAAVAAHSTGARRSLSLPAELDTAGARIHAAVVDIGDPVAVRSAFASATAALGAIDILINNAGATHNPVLERTTPEIFRDDVNVNVNGAYNCAHAVLPEMTRRRAGVIVNIGSVNGLGRVRRRGVQRRQGRR